MFSTIARYLAPTVFNQVGSAAVRSSTATSSAALCLRPLSTAPTVYDYLIRFHVIDRDGKRHTLKGLSGDNLAGAMHASGAFPQFDDFTFGPEIKEPDAHVYVSNEYSESLGMMSDEEKAAISHCADEVRQKCAADSSDPNTCTPALTYIVHAEQKCCAVPEWRRTSYWTSL